MHSQIYSNKSYSMHSGCVLHATKRDEFYKVLKRSVNDNPLDRVQINVFFSL